MHQKKEWISWCIKYKKLDKKFYKKRDCSETIKHDTSKFEKFYEELINKNLKKYNKIQKNYVRNLFKTNECFDINTIHSNFKSEFNIPLKLTNNQIYKETNIDL